LLYCSYVVWYIVNICVRQMSINTLTYFFLIHCGCAASRGLMLAIACGFPVVTYLLLLLVVSFSQPSFSHSSWEIKFQRYRVHDLDHLGLRDVICHVIIALGIWGFLLVVNTNRPSISHGCWDIELQRFRGHFLDFLIHVTSSLTWPLNSQYGVSYRWSIWTDHLSRTVMLGSRPWLFVVTRRHRSCNHWTRTVWFPIMNRPCISHGCSDIELQRFWGHDLDVISHVTIGLLIIQFPMSGPLKSLLYLASLLRYYVLNT